MTNAERTELKMWIRRLDSCNKALTQFSGILKDDNLTRLTDAAVNLDFAIIHLEAIK